MRFYKSFLVRTGVVTGVVAGLLGLASGFTCYRWQGSFLHVEYRFRFRNREGGPVQGVTLAVYDERGRLAFGYPVSDFTQENALVSDARGELVFHHVKGGPEFGGASCR